jgi:hypothetical protein
MPIRPPLHDLRLWSGCVASSDNERFPDSPRCPPRRRCGRSRSAASGSPRCRRADRPPRRSRRTLPAGELLARRASRLPAAPPAPLRAVPAPRVIRRSRASRRAPRSLSHVALLELGPIVAEPVLTAKSVGYRDGAEKPACLNIRRRSTTICASMSLPCGRRSTSVSPASVTLSAPSGPSDAAPMLSSSDLTSRHSMFPLAGCANSLLRVSRWWLPSSSVTVARGGPWSAC